MDSDEIICVICLECNNDNENQILQFDHCGTYYVHQKCQQKWFNLNNTCFICREIFFSTVEDNSESELNLIIINNNNNNVNNNQIYFGQNNIKYFLSFLCYTFWIFFIINELYYLIIINEEN